MRRNSTTATALPVMAMSPVGKAMEEASASFERFCLAAGIEALGEMMQRDAAEACGARHSRVKARRGYRWGRTRGKIGFHGGKVDIADHLSRRIVVRQGHLQSPDLAKRENDAARRGPERFSRRRAHPVVRSQPCRTALERVDRQLVVGRQFRVFRR